MKLGGAVSQIFGAENLKDVLPKLVDTLGLDLLLARVMIDFNI